MNNRSPFQFGISTLLLLTVLVAVIMSAGMVAPILGVALGLMSVASLIRAYIVVRAYCASGHSLSNREKIRLFLAGLPIAYVILLLSVAAYFIFGVIGSFLAMLFASSSQSRSFVNWASIVGCLFVTAQLLRVWFLSPKDRFGIWRIR